MDTYIGFDFGLKRIGLAVGQSLTGTATPLVTLKAVGGKPDWQELDRLLQQWKPAGLVLGLPVRADGSENPVAKKAREFARNLQERYSLPVFWINEELSSHEAQKLLRGKPNKHNKADIDQLSAKIILESWLAQDISVKEGH